ncbi:MAG: AAA family ATPase, partial [Nitrospira sp.]|nr:AAA family ATPase [Nitrospira sp.]
MRSSAEEESEMENNPYEDYENMKRAVFQIDEFKDLIADEEEIENANLYYDVDLYGVEDPEEVDQFKPEESIFRMTDEEFEEKSAQLNADQKAIVDEVDQYFNQRKKGEMPEPLKLFVTGGAGVGKTFLIHLLTEHVNRRLQKKAVVLTAPTGCAAKLIGGSTLHHALNIPVNKGVRYYDYQSNLAEKTKHDLQKKYKDLEILIIDEVSMCGPDIIRFCSMRMNEIFELNNDGD